MAKLASISEKYQLCKSEDWKDNSLLTRWPAFINANVPHLRWVTDLAVHGPHGDPEQSREDCLRYIRTSSEYLSLTAEDKAKLPKQDQDFINHFAPLLKQAQHQVYDFLTLAADPRMHFIFSHVPRNRDQCGTAAWLAFSSTSR